MLSVQEYCGDILNFKTYSKSYKNKKLLENDRENWAIFKDVHEPIIERAVFEQVQQKRGERGGEAAAPAGRKLPQEARAARSRGRAKIDLSRVLAEYGKNKMC